MRNKTRRCWSDATCDSSLFLDAYADEIATAAWSLYISQRRLIDIEEAGFELSRVNHKYGHSIASVRIRKHGH